MKKRLLQNFLENEDGTRHMLEACLAIAATAKEIVIFGAGVGGEMLFNILKKNGLSEKVRAFCDNNQLKQGTSYCGKKVLDPGELAILSGGGKLT